MLKTAKDFELEKIFIYIDREPTTNIRYIANNESIYVNINDCNTRFNSKNSDYQGCKCIDYLQEPYVLLDDVNKKAKTKILLRKLTGWC